MSKRGLTKESVLDAAEQLVTQHGAEYLTTVTLARELGIKPASLYNHISSTEELRKQLALRAIHALSGTRQFRRVDGEFCQSDKCQTAGGFQCR